MDISCTVIGKVCTQEGYAIELEEEYRKGLTGLEGFSHILVVWYAHQAISLPSDALVIPKPYQTGPEQIGIFATRSPYRVNPICLSVVSVKSIDKETGTIHVDWIDALQDSPVLDIKPYHGSEDRVRDYHTPPWCAHWPQWIEESEHFDWDAEFTF